MEDRQKLVFQFFNEVGIIHQLSSTIMNRLLPNGLHVSHFSVLNHMVRLGDGKTPLELARAFQVTKATMTHTLATLEKRQLIHIVPHKTDGRSKVVLISEKGRAFQAEAIASLVPAMTKLSGQLDLDKIVELVPELAKIRAVLDENRDVV